MSIADEISKMNNLRNNGLITDAEFETQKLRLLDGGSVNPTPTVIHYWSPMPGGAPTGVPAMASGVGPAGAMAAGAPAAASQKTYTTENNSGAGQDVFPEGVARWAWGPFLLNWIWAIGNKAWIGLLALIPVLNLGIAIYLGIKGRELAWKSKRWESLEAFNETQGKWDSWAIRLTVIFISLYVITTVAVSMV